MTEICVNLTAAEAKAWASGATVLIRPLEPVRKRSSVVHLIDGFQYGTCGIGDVLIGREAFRVEIDRGAEWVVYSADDVRRVKPVKVGLMRRAPASSARMPEALARHRRTVVSVRVCHECNVTWEEASAAVGATPVTSALQWRIAMGFLGLNFGDSWVSVTTTEAADVR